MLVCVVWGWGCAPAGPGADAPCAGPQRQRSELGGSRLAAAARCPAAPKRHGGAARAGGSRGRQPSRCPEAELPARARSLARRYKRPRPLQLLICLPPLHIRYSRQRQHAAHAPRDSSSTSWVSAFAKAAPPEPLPPQAQPQTLARSLAVLFEVPEAAQDALPGESARAYVRASGSPASPAGPSQGRGLLRGGRAGAGDRSEPVRALPAPAREAASTPLKA